MVTWDQSVEKARNGDRKSFQGRMEIADASFEQIPPGSGRNKKGDKTLDDFSEEIGYSTGTIKNYRWILSWFGRKSHPDMTFLTWPIVKLAKSSGNWETGQDFTTFLKTHRPPKGFNSWSPQALETYLGNNLTMPNQDEILQPKPQQVNVVEPEEPTPAKKPDPTKVALEEAAEELDSSTPFYREKLRVRAKRAIKELRNNIARNGYISQEEENETEKWITELSIMMIDIHKKENQDWNSTDHEFLEQVSHGKVE